ncbi:Clathrin light chain [Blattella germanica]|nr:Clathrin light chain [Blattella germanica]
MVDLAEFLACGQGKLTSLGEELTPTSEDCSFPLQGSVTSEMSYFEILSNLSQHKELECKSKDQQSDLEFKLIHDPHEGNEFITTKSPFFEIRESLSSEETETITSKWKQEQRKRLEEKDINEERKNQELREAAKKELEEWYRLYEEQISKRKIANRNAQKQFIAKADEIETGREWQGIGKLCDFNPKFSNKGKDVSRMRSILLHLKNKPSKSTPDA